MAHHGIPNRVFKISELTRLIAVQLVLAGEKSAVNFACTCRYLEEPVLSMLWETQSSLCYLLEVLPEENLGCQYLVSDRHLFRVIGDPSPESWNRVKRYASWMHQVHMDEGLALDADTLRQLRFNSPTGGWFPALQELHWRITKHTLPYLDLFLSPQLKRVFISASLSRRNSRAPQRIQQLIASSMSALPAPAIQLLFVEAGSGTPWPHFTDSLSSVVLRCGPLLLHFNSPVPLSDAAVTHLIHLPHLRTLHVEGPPPHYPASSLPLTFPPLTELTLGKGAAHGWLSLLKRLQGVVSVTRGAMPLSKLKDSLEFLYFLKLSGPTIDIFFTSTIQIFGSLVHVSVNVDCHDGDGEGQCVFKLNDDDVADLAVALPQLRCLFLGRACYENTCATTVASLLAISVHCIKLQDLEIHFNTTNIVDDLEGIPDNPRFQHLRFLPRCTLSCLTVSQTPLTLDGPCLETVADGLFDIFPSLECCDGFERVWDELSGRIVDHWEV